MSSSTVTKPFITESWIHLKQQPHGLMNKEESRQPKQDKYKKTTSHKLRPSDTDIGMSHSGIYDAFDEVNRLEKKKSITRKYDDTRRKSTTADIKRTTTTKNEVISSPRLRTLNTKKSTDQTDSKASPKLSHIIQGRRQTLSGPLTTRTSEEDTNSNSINSTTHSNPNSIHNHNTHPTINTHNTVTTPNRKSKNGLIKLADILQDTLAEERRKLGLSPSVERAERRLSVRQPSSLSNSEEDKVKSIVNKAYRRTSVVRERIQKEEPRKRTLSTGATLQPPPRNKAIITPPPQEANYMRPTLADQRRHSAVSSLSRQSSRKQYSPMTSEDDKEDRKKTVLAMARQKKDKEDSGDENLSKYGRHRKQSMVEQQDSLLVNRRMSRTESLKEGLPTSPSVQAKLARRKSIKQESPVKKKEDPAKSVVRKRGKTLPGSLAKPPTVQSLQLPPMKVEPIKLTLPKSTKRIPKSPSVKALNTRSSSAKQPDNSPSSSSSSTETPKKSLSTRKAKGSSHLGIRRSSIKTPSAIVDSPRVKATRRMSTDKTTERKMSVASISRKNSLVEEDKNKHRATSLREKLEAMVAQHSIQERDYTEERVRPQRIKDSLSMWDKEMVEAFSPGVPKSPQVAIKYYGHSLSPYEQTEIHSYPEIYFVGHHAKKRQSMPDKPALNYNYDDERGDYQSVTHDHLGYRYEVIEELGRGSFGQVVKCYDHKTAATVAVKLIRNKKRFYAQAKTEVKILSDLVKWDPLDKHHNVRMTDSFYFRNHLCIASECLEMNLYEFIKINNFQGFHLTLIKRFTVQLLRSLELLFQHGVIHCDLKPENILLKQPNKSTIKVIDFGSSCLENNRVYTYIQSRFYRSPEIILGLDYTTAIDMWSLGCIIAELYTGVPIFPGENEQEQLACIMEVLGVPDMALVQSSERKHLFFDRRGEPRTVCNSRGKQRKAGSKTLAQALRCNDPLFLDFISQCLMWDSTKRLTPDSAFKHEWIAQCVRPPSLRTSAVPSPTTGNEEASSGYLSRKNSIKPPADTIPSEVM